MGYIYSPSTIKKVKKKLSKTDKEYVKIIVRSWVLIGIILTTTAFGSLFLFSNINNLWSFFKPKETYVEDNPNKPAKPYLKANQEFTNEETVDLEGIAKQGNKVILYKNNNVEADAIANSENKYQFSNISISTGEGETTTFFTIVENSDGEQSEESNEVVVTFDKEKPELVVTSPKADDRIKSFSRTLTVEGTTEEDVKVVVNGRQASINTNNEFSATIRLENEVNVIEVIATDKANNETKIQVPVYFEKID